MHILVVNDDGPPSTHSSPYVHSLVRELQAAGHVVSVCLPHTQRSWIGKAHMIGQTVKPLYYRPPAAGVPAAGLERQEGEPENEGTLHRRPYRAAKTETETGAAPEEWVLVDGTPASCVQIGLYHLFAERGPVDLVVSGPNYGRNTSAMFALSSGTLGGALEAASCRRRAIAVSYAFYSREHDRAAIAAATRQAVRVIDALVRQWPSDGSVDLYSVNVPLVADIETRKVLWAEMLQNYWRGDGGGCFAAVEATYGEGDDATADEGDDDDIISDGKDAEEEHIRRGEGGGASTPEKGKAAAAKTTFAHIPHKHYKWQPQLGDVHKSVDDAPPGNDGWAVREKYTSITPLKANFWQAATELHKTEFQLDAPPVTAFQGLAVSSPATDPLLYALVSYDDAYVQPILVSALQSLVPKGRLCLLDSSAAAAAAARGSEPFSLEAALAREIGSSSSLPAKVLQITPYEALDFDYADAHAQTTRINSYVFRKALIRKHFLASTVEQWVAKRPASALVGHVQRTESFEVDYAEFLDDALVEAFDLRASLERNAEEEVARKKEWWILKPSMSDRGQGIRLFSTMDDLQAIFDGWEPDEDSEDEGGEGGEGDDDDDNDNIMTSHLRHFVAQPYLDPPLLLPGTGGRKFHIRVYVLCVGALQVYVYRDMLALFAAHAYTAPWEGAGVSAGEGDGDGPDLAAHLTNTCLQDEADKGDAVRRFWDLEEPRLGGDDHDKTAASKAAIFDQICRVTGELFEAAAVGTPIHFQPLAHAFEVYGLDFLVDGAGTAWLLEVNAFPDFRQTGTGLQTLVAEFWTEALRLVLGSFQVPVEESHGSGGPLEGPQRMVLVKDLDLGRR